MDWGALFNFRFEIDSPPYEAMAQLAIHEPGAGMQLEVATLGPMGIEIFSDGLESGDTDAWQVE